MFIVVRLVKDDGIIWFGLGLSWNLNGFGYECDY